MKKVFLMLAITFLLTTSNKAVTFDIYGSWVNSDISIFQAISEGQQALDGNSYTKKLLEGLGGKADLNNDGKIMLQEIRLYLEIEGLNGELAKKKQTPWSFVGSDFVFLDKKKENQANLALGKTKFINVAIDKYKTPDLPVLVNAVKEAKEIQQFFSQNDKNKEISFTSLFNETATRENIINALNDAKAETIIIYLSGHSDSDLFVPYEFDPKNIYLSAISTDTIIKILKTSRSRALVISDTCLLWESATTGLSKKTSVSSEENKPTESETNQILRELKKQ